MWFCLILGGDNRFERENGQFSDGAGGWFTVIGQAATSAIEFATIDYSNWKKGKIEFLFVIYSV